MVVLTRETLIEYKGKNVTVAWLDEKVNCVSGQLIKLSDDAVFINLKDGSNRIFVLPFDRIIKIELLGDGDDGRRKKLL
jgi:hypothetical protein